MECAPQQQRLLLQLEPLTRHHHPHHHPPPITMRTINVLCICILPLSKAPELVFLRVLIDKRVKRSRRPCHWRIIKSMTLVPMGAFQSLTCIGTRRRLPWMPLRKNAKRRDSSIPLPTTFGRATSWAWTVRRNAKILKHIVLVSIVPSIVTWLSSTSKRLCRNTTNTSLSTVKTTCLERERIRRTGTAPPWRREISWPAVSCSSTMEVRLCCGCVSVYNGRVYKDWHASPCALIHEREKPF
jgi:hypothetical protein